MTYNYHDQLLLPGDLVFDVGAYLGDKTAEFLDLGMRVVCFEPQEWAAQRLRKRFGDKATVAQTALGKVQGYADLTVARGSRSLATLRPDLWAKTRFGHPSYKMEKGKAESVPITTLDQAIYQYGVPQYVKIDAEGSDLDILEGLTVPVGALSFEFLAEAIPQMEKAVAQAVRIVPDATFQAVVGNGAAIIPHEWTDAKTIVRLLRAASRQDANLWGDVFVRSKDLLEQRRKEAEAEAQAKPEEGLEVELEQRIRDVLDRASEAVSVYHIRHWTPVAKDPFYDHRFNWLRGPLDWQWMERAVYATAEMREGDNVLDLCCGDGMFSRMFADRARLVDGIDRNPLALHIAQANYANERVRFYNQDVVSEPFPNPPYNVVVWFAAIEHFAPADVHALLDKAGRALVPDGILIGSTPAGGGSNPEHQCAFPNEESLHEMLGQHFARVTTWASRWDNNRVEMYFRCQGWLEEVA